MLIADSSKLKGKAKDARPKVQGSKRLIFFPCALSVEPCASLNSGYWYFIKAI
jgi:hypothetical protein